MTLFFVTDRSDAHVARFDQLFQTLPSEYQLVRVGYAESGEPQAPVNGGACHSWESIRESLSGEGSVVISGPLDAVSIQLETGGFRHVGISFATDIMVTAAGDFQELARLRDFVPHLDAVITDNYAAENALLSLGAAQEGILRIPWGPAEAPIQRTMTKTECGWPEDRLIVLYPRSLEPHYDPYVFLEALGMVVDKYPHVLAVLVETGSRVDAVKKTVADKGLNDHVHFEPLQEPEVFRAKMGSADFVVVTPQTDGTSVTVLDAMQLGVPVVSSLTAGSAEWVVDGITGWTFPVGDYVSLARAMEKVLDLKDSYRELVCTQAQRLVAEKAGWQKSSERLAGLVRDLLSLD